MIMTKYILILVIPLIWVTVCRSANILVVVPTPSYSHQVVFQSLWRELSLRGHQVTAITTDPLRDPTLTNLTEIDVSFSYDIWNPKINDIVLEHKNSPMNSMFMIFDAIVEIADKQLSHPEVQKLLTKQNYFDLLIVEYALAPFIAMAKHFDVPYIGMLSFEANNMMLEPLGAPIHPIAYPDTIMSEGTMNNFRDRLNAVTGHVMGSIFTWTHFYIPQAKLVEKYYGSGIDVIEAFENVSMLFLNTDLVFNQIRPLGPNIIHIGGGSHRSAPKPLPANIKKILDDAHNGFVYFSLGSNVKSKDMPQEKLDIILTTFRQLPQYTFLWKFELDQLPGGGKVPDNVFISKWFPQQDIFKHPGIKLFITQGGLQSLDEAIYDHVPLLGIPMFADQPANIRRIVNKEMGLGLQYDTLNIKDFTASILEVITNPKYKDNIRRLTKLARDEPMTGLEKAVWWTEYVLRHKGARHLRSPALDLPAYQYYLLDVLGFLLAMFAISIYVIVKIVSVLRRLICDSSKPKSKIE